MGLKHMSGFEGAPKIREAGTGAYSFPAGRTGQCVHVPGATSYSIGLIGVLSEFVMGVAVQPENGWGSSNAQPIVWEFWSQAGAEVTFVFRREGTMEVRRGDSNGTLLAQPSAVLVPTGRWDYIETKIKIAQSGGYINVWANGTQIVSYTGDTQSSTEASPALQTIFLKGPNTANAGNCMYDDFYLLDHIDATATMGRPFNDVLGQPRIEPLLPNGNGASSDFVGSDGNSVDNYLLVDESPPSATDYVESTTVGHRDLYEFANPTLVGNVLAVEVNAFAASPDGGTNPLKSVRRSSGGTVAVGPGAVPASTFRQVSDGASGKDPDGNIWTTAAVAAAQFGIEVG